MTTNATVNDINNSPTPDANEQSESQPPSSCHLDALSPPQLIALNALSIGRRINQAADAAGVTPRTINRWLHTPAFRAALNHEIQERNRQAALRATCAADLALDALTRIIESDADPATMIKAARAIFHHRAQVNPPTTDAPHTTSGSTSPAILAQQDRLAERAAALFQSLPD
jgi:hypothetical protein